jgi:two-component system phosphate regulon sensor histidine kinase PhoR
VALGSILLFGAFAIGMIYQTKSRDTLADLRAKAYYLANAMEGSGQDYLKKVRGYSGRITLIGADGVVLFDDREPAANMENHFSRPEVRQALETGAGYAQRLSGTLGERTIYYALRLQDGKVLRVSATAESVLGGALRMLPWMAVVMGLLTILAGFVARRQTRAIVEPINKIDMDRPLAENAYEELSPLLRRIAAQKSELGAQLAMQKERQEEFDTITRNMDEGLVVVNREGIVISLNESAKDILNVREGNPCGRHILTLSRNIALEQAVHGAAEGRRVSEVIDLDQKKYQMTASPSTSSGEVQGIVILLLDETEKALAEQKRREFSANVSHELKTPLTSISGYAEIIHNGLAKPADIREFAGRIHGEATRLVSLVDDIIRLSRLDEKGGNVARLQVNMYALAQRIAESLAQKARKNGIAIEVRGEIATVHGVPSILDEVLYNLVDNAIRYSKNGTVEITVAKDGKAVTVAVRDEGIGIPKEHQNSIFERFYRVDKSHSRESGGTGLGLAIVKRGVMFHGGNVTLTSEPHKGSTFTITIPYH